MAASPPPGLHFTSPKAPLTINIILLWSVDLCLPHFFFGKLHQSQWFNNTTGIGGRGGGLGKRCMCISPLDTKYCNTFPVAAGGTAMIHTHAGPGRQPHTTKSSNRDRYILRRLCICASGRGRGRGRGVGAECSHDDACNSRLPMMTTRRIVAL